MSPAEWPYIAKQLFAQLLIAYLTVLAINEFILWFSAPFILTFGVITALVGVITIFSRGEPEKPEATPVKQANALLLLGLFVIGEGLLFFKVQETLEARWSTMTLLAVNLLGLLFLSNGSKQAEEKPTPPLKSTMVILITVILAGLTLGGFTALSALLIGLYLFVLTGFVWSLIIFDDDEVDALERLGFSLLFSAVALPLILFYLSRLGFPVTPINVYLVVFALSSIPLLLIYWRGRRGRPGDQSVGQ